MKITHPPFRVRRGKPARSGAPVVRIQLGNQWRDFPENDALAIADKIVDTIEQQRKGTRQC